MAAACLAVFPLDQRGGNPFHFFNMKGPTFTLDRFPGETLTLWVGKYQHGGNTAVEIQKADGDPDFSVTLSINIPEMKFPEVEFIFKTYSENEGLLEELIALDLIEKSDLTVDVGMAGPQPVCRLV